jgi:hypothetical protein
MLWLHHVGTVSTRSLPVGLYALDATVSQAEEMIHTNTCAVNVRTPGAYNAGKSRQRRYVDIILPIQLLTSVVTKDVFRYSLSKVMEVQCIYIKPTSIPLDEVLRRTEGESILLSRSLRSTWKGVRGAFRMRFPMSRLGCCVVRQNRRAFRYNRRRLLQCGVKRWRRHGGAVAWYVCRTFASLLLLPGY